MKILDGKLIAKRVKDELKEKVARFVRERGREISLAVVMVGNNSASAVYVRNKIKAAEYVGIRSLSFVLPENAAQSDVEEIVRSLAADESVDGILVQLPLPPQIDENAVLSLIPPEKDVDGFTDVNVGRLLLGKDCSAACTPKGIMTMLKSEGISLSEKNAVVVGRSNIVGKPMAILLLRENATVTICHSHTKDLKEVCKRADILVAAIGKPKFFNRDYIKEGAVVIDVGIHRNEQNKLCGDVDRDDVMDLVSAITPVPGGVGPMTIAMLMYNCVEAVRLQKTER